MGGWGQGQVMTELKTAAFLLAWPLVHYTNISPRPGEQVNCAKLELARKGTTRITTDGAVGQQVGNKSHGQKAIPGFPRRAGRASAIRRCA